MKNELFSKFVSISENRSVGVYECPGSGIVIRGRTFDPDTGVSSAQGISFSIEAAVILTEILNEWVKRPL